MAYAIDIGAVAMRKWWDVRRAGKEHPHQLPAVTASPLEGEAFGACDALNDKTDQLRWGIMSYRRSKTRSGWVSLAASISGVVSPDMTRMDSMPLFRPVWMSV